MSRASGLRTSGVRRLTTIPICCHAGADPGSPPLHRFAAIERELHVPPPPLLSVHPLVPLFEASQLLQTTHARRLPLIDVDEQTGGDVVLSVLTQYRVLKFIAVNVRLPNHLAWRYVSPHD
jgi:hypothetical protein